MRRACRSRAQPVLVLGKRPRDDLSRAAQGLRRTRARHPVPGTGRALVCRHRDLIDPDFCRLAFYEDLGRSQRYAEDDRSRRCRDGRLLRAGGRRGRRWVQRTARGVTAFYDIDTPVTLAKLERGDLRISVAGSDPGLRSLSLLHGRPDAADDDAPLRLAGRARALLLGRSRGLSADWTEPTAGI